MNKETIKLELLSEKTHTKKVLIELALVFSSRHNYESKYQTIYPLSLLHIRYQAPNSQSRDLIDISYTRSHVMIKDNVTCVILMFICVLNVLPSPDAKVHPLYPEGRHQSKDDVQILLVRFVDVSGLAH